MNNGAEHARAVRILGLACTIALGALLATGCADKRRTTTYRSLDGDKVTITRDGDRTIIKAREGETGDTAVIREEPGKTRIEACEAASRETAVIEARADGTTTITATGKDGTAAIERP